jgi:hypothetical protein
VSEQIDIFGNSHDAMPTPLHKATDKEKRNWEDAFQKWSNKELQDGHYGYGACGYGSMCDYCKDNTYGRPCVRALNEMCREKHIVIDYSKREFEKIWEGVF